MALGSGDGPLPRAVRRVVLEHKATGGTLSVREVARRLLIETDSDPAHFEALVEALCAECIANSVIIEFRSPEG